MAKRIRIGMIGCGGNGRGHLRCLAAHGEVEVAALADTSAEMIARTRSEVPALAAAAAFDDYRRMLAEVECDAAVISTPHTQHTEQVLACLDAGLHVLCEKPLACSVADTRKVVARAKARRRHVVVSFQRRWHAMRKFMRSFVRDSGFGTPLYVQSFVSQGWLSLTANTWRQQKAHSGGGQLNDTGAHIIDMIFWIMPSRPTEVAAFIDNRKTEVDIDSAVSYRFADGAIGSLSVLGSGPRNVFWEDMTIAGSTGRAMFLRQGVLTVSTGNETMEYKSFGRDGMPDHHFIDVIRRRAKNESPPEQFMPAIAFTEACWKSAAAGGRPMKIRY